MPNAPTHDAITFLLTAPAAAGVYAMVGEPAVSIIAAAGFLFGGLMFGPDLDTASKQYSRWGPFKLVWYPYRSVFKHRSRWSHGLIFGTFIRVAYLFGILSIAGWAAAFAIGLGYGHASGAFSGWHEIGGLLGPYVGPRNAVAFFAGAWLGAASHTITDITVSYIRTGRVNEFL